jgi:predicted metal-dependent phosphoesterase TrpH
MPRPRSSLTLTPDAPIDLQLHTTNSDGLWSAEQLLDHVAASGFALVAVTDHDRLDTVAAVQHLGARKGVPVLAAVELSAAWGGQLLDLLCYGFEPHQNALGGLAEATRQAQAENIRETYAALQRRGYHFPSARDILAPGTDAPRHVGDLVALLRGHGYAAEMHAALHEAGFRWVTADPAAVVDAAHRSGAVCLIAHPGRGEPFARFDAPRLNQLRSTVPVDGLEVYHPSHTAEQACRFLDYARAHGLLTSAGSDSHGPPGPLPIKYPAETSRELLEHLGIQVR